jgi:hypothetical protein
MIKVGSHDNSYQPSFADSSFSCRRHQEDRDEYTQKIMDTDQALDRISAEQQEAVAWAKAKQEMFISETRDLQTELARAKEEAVQQVHAPASCTYCFHLTFTTFGTGTGLQRGFGQRDSGT